LIYRYAIIDDDDDFPSAYKDHVVLTDPFSGITKEVATRAIELLMV
jgi:hypothetical protein